MNNNQKSGIPMSNSPKSPLPLQLHRPDSLKATESTEKLPIDEFDVPVQKYSKLISKITKAFGKLPRLVLLIQIENARARFMGDICYSIKTLVSFENEITPCSIQLNESRYKNTETIDIACPEKNYHAVITKENPCNQNQMALNETDEFAANNWNNIGDLIVKSLIELGKLEQIYYGLVKMTDVQCMMTDELKYVVKAKFMKTNFKVINCELEIFNRPSNWNVIIHCQKNIFNVCKDDEEHN
jgi:hypothetical protein